jgi:uncharacterized protein (DUF1778 family)
MPATKAAAPTVKEDRLYVRMSPDQKQRVTRAARTRHLTTSQFVVQATLDAAEAVLADQTVFHLSPEQWEAFQARLDEPPRDIPALKKLFSEPLPF